MDFLANGPATFDIRSRESQIVVFYESGLAEERLTSDVPAIDDAR